MVVRSFLLPCSAVLLLCTSLFSACANAADFADDDDSTDAAADVTVVADGGSSSGKASSSSSSGGSSGGSSSGGSSSSSGSSAACGDLKINEVRSDTNDFVEIYNAGDCDVDMADYKLVYHKAVGGTTDTTLMASGSGTLGPQEFFLLGASGVAGTDATMGAEIAVAGGNIALKKGSTSIDEVCYGTGDCSYGEGTAAAAPSGSGSISRTPDGADSDDNSNDFTTTSATPGAANQ